MLPGQASPAVVAQAATPAVAVRAGDDPPTAFAALARSAAQHATERPSEPVVLAPPAGGAVAAVTPTVDFAGGHEVDVTRSLRVANRRVSALRAVVIALVAVNVVVVIVAAVAIFTGGDPGGAVPAAGDGAEVSE